ncbi:hypothetical protein CDAR_128441 [Caerostris darwini]|uniref:Uncharacterized protein n=1 Tax=Caerostris darwini TaxID=1538125 RepID=A0AAV4PDE0_9ARAC|nr:hypothetical protein CDAR_128441 [Caerostris darwini]
MEKKTRKYLILDNHLISSLFPLSPPPPFSLTLLSSREEFPKRETDARCHGYEIVEDPPHPPEQKKELTRFRDVSLLQHLCHLFQLVRTESPLPCQMR